MKFSVVSLLLGDRGWIHLSLPVIIVDRLKRGLVHSIHISFSNLHLKYTRQALGRSCRRVKRCRLTTKERPKSATHGNLDCIMTGTDVSPVLLGQSSSLCGLPVLCTSSRAL